MDLPDFLTSDAYGYIHLVGHRIGLMHVVNRYNEGCSAEQLSEEFDTLSLPLIQQVIDFYLANKREVDEYIAEERAEIDRQIAATPQLLNMDELRRRYEEYRRSQGRSVVP